MILLGRTFACLCPIKKKCDHKGKIQDSPHNSATCLNFSRHGFGCTPNVYNEPLGYLNGLQTKKNESIP